MIMLIHFILSHDTRIYSVFQVTEVGGLQRSYERGALFFPLSGTVSRSLSEQSGRMALGMRGLL